MSKKKIADKSGAEFAIEDIAEPKEAGFLQGNLLVSTTQIQDACFKHSVIFVASHNETGAMGLIINKEQKNVPTQEVLKGLGIDADIKTKQTLPLFFGGPVEGTRGFVIHSDDYKIKNTVSYENGVSISSEKQAVEDFIAGKGADEMYLVLGYAGWVQGQLEKEVEEGAWITVPASKQLVFETPNDAKWKKAAASEGIDITKLTPFVGSA